MSEYFIKISYKTEGNNKTYKSYLFTKKGCEFIANKFTGEKGILFTAKYVEKFNKMEHWKLLRKLNGTTKDIGIIPVLRDNDFVVSKYFIEIL